MSWSSPNKKLLICASLVLAIGYLSYAQDQRIADSLRPLYASTKLSEIDRLELLRDLSFNEMNDLDLAQAYADELIALANASKHPESAEYAYRGHRNKGYALRDQGRYYEALISFYNAQRAAMVAGYLDGEAMAKLCIADTAAFLGDETTSEVYYEKSIRAFQELTDDYWLGMALANAGDSHLDFKNFDRAIEYLTRAHDIFEEQDDPNALAYISGNIGVYHAAQGDVNKGERMLLKSIAVLKTYRDFAAISEFELALGRLYFDLEEIDKAKRFTRSGMNYAINQGLTRQIGEANSIWAKILDLDGRYSEASTHRTIADSIDNTFNKMRMESIRLYLDMSQQAMRSEQELALSDLKDKRQRAVMLATSITLFLIIVLAVVIYRRYVYVRQTSRIISDEKERSDSLLLNILPKDTAEELKSSGQVQAKKYNSVTVLFTDFLSFTEYADNLPPEELVKAVDHYFSHFDTIMEKYDLEKIKTVGDAYLCAGGLPDPSVDHARRMILAALDILDFVRRTKIENPDKICFEVRIGISTGPVVAGVVGTKKFAYDIWGDTVNCASRMETHSEPGKINISENTYDLIKDEFECEYRGLLDVKNKGKMKMYYVLPEGSAGKMKKKSSPGKSDRPKRPESINS
ncbi:MAG: tetratricopeptide repeat protein [Flavobacteriaceae bacterium]|nr:tetratricopeptide repeat protein [Flavobacteriaceae bacterium]